MSFEETAPRSLSDTFRHQYALASNYLITAETRKDIFAGERAVRTLEMGLMNSLTDSEKESVRDLRGKQTRIDMKTPQDKDRFVDNLMERLDILVKVMERKGMLN